MLRASYLLLESFKKLKRIQEGISEKTDIETLRRRIDYEYKNTILHFNDLISCISDNYSNDFIEKRDLFVEMMSFSMELPKCIQISNYMKQTLNIMPAERILQNLDEYDQSSNYRLRSNDYDFCNRIDDNTISKIVRNLKSFRKINVLDSRTKKGINASNFKRYFAGNADIYGMEVDPFLANTAKHTGAYLKMAKGGLNYSKCSNLAFDVVMHAPEYIAEAEFTPQQTLKIATEIADARKVTLYLKYGGILIYFMPKYKMNVSFCTFMAKNFEELSIIEDDSDRTMVVIVAKRKVYSENVDEQLYLKLRNITIDTVECDTTPNEYEIDGTLEEIKIFRGSILDESDIFEIVESTNLLGSFINKQSLEKKESEKHQPLLPFNLGQIGLVLTSGCLDGVIEELPGQNHVIKGAVKKESVTEIIKGQTKAEDEIRTVHLNKVQIKILTPDGEIKTLA